MDSSRRLVSRALMAIGMAAASCEIAAQPPFRYPNRPIRLVLPMAAGGGLDTVGRLIARTLSDAFQQPVVVDNKPGASGVIAASFVANSPPDGYTVLLGITTLAQLPGLQAKLPFDVERDFIPVTLVAKARNVLVVSREANVGSVPELLAGIRARPERFNFGSYGNGSTSHFLGEMLALHAKGKPTHLPYKGAGPMMSDLLAGTFAYAFPDVVSVQPHLKSDRVRVLAVTGKKRLSSLPNIPTLDELGLKDFDLGAWGGFLVAKGTRPEVVEILSRQINLALKDKQVHAMLAATDQEIVGGTPQDFERFLHADIGRWGEIAKAAEIRAD